MLVDPKILELALNEWFELWRKGKFKSRFETFKKENLSKAPWSDFTFIYTDKICIIL